MDRPAFVPDNDQTFAGDLRDKVITRFWALTVMPNQNPFLGKNLLFFLRKNLRGDKIALRQGLSSSRECLSRLAKGWRNVCLRRWHLTMLHAAHVRVNALIAAPSNKWCSGECVSRKSHDCRTRALMPPPLDKPLTNRGDFLGSPRFS